MLRSVKILVYVLVISLSVSALVFFTVIYPHRPYAKILLYHSVVNNDNNPDPIIGIKLFNRQVDHLIRHGYKTVFLSDIVRRYKEKRPVPDNWVVLTFDGGYDDFYHKVYPILKKHNLKATLFVITSEIGEEGSVSWSELLEMKNSRLIEIGSHSHKHLPPTCIGLSEAKKEKSVSKAILEKQLGIPVRAYAYPYGAINDQVKDLVKETGYDCAVGIAYRLGECKLKDVYNLRRVYVSEFSRYPFMFRFMLSGYYVPTRGLALRVLNIKAPRDVGDCSDWHRENRDIS